MTEQDIANALRAHLSTTPGAAPIVWENAPGAWNGTGYTTPATPFWAVSQVKTPPDRLGLDNFHMMRGRLVVSIMAKDGSFTAQAETHAEAIIAHFAEQALTAGDGKVRIIQRPYADDGFNDGAYWRVNVHIRWQAIA